MSTARSLTASPIRRAGLSADGRRLELVWDDGVITRYPAAWLRDNCPSGFHPNGQRLAHILDLPEDPVMLDASPGDGVVGVRWSDGADSRFDAGWLAAHRGWSPEPGPAVTHWDGSLPVERWDFERLTSAPRALAECLGWWAAHGFALVTGAPLETDALERVVPLLGGAIRETNYGRLFDVRSVAAPDNLADTSLALRQHTDNPYRDPAPTVQLLHCLRSDAAGGASALVDGFAAAAALRAADPGSFDLLTRVPVEFRYRAPGVDLRARRPLIRLDESGEPSCIAFNTRSMAPLRMAPDVTERYYAAFRAFAQVVESDSAKVRFTLAPGDVLVMDNRRTLHGREAFSGAGARLLRGCYAERDGLMSRWRTLPAGPAR